ncbi:hypothetical protein GQX74_014467 [Glossina fuscipes]|nr:hypothetical protein GQX74_014467 [Glossina fuscipes]
MIPAQIAKTLTREIEERIEKTFEGTKENGDEKLGRASKQLDIDMRIGVHSGSLLGGIIGAAKWQYDIWSIDVDIANRLEATGMPGRVHVSNNALRLAQNFYEYENGTEKAKLDPVLIKNKVKTFLIIDKNESMQKSLEWRNYRRMNEEARRRETGDSGLVSYQDIISDANKSMETEVDKLPICKFHNQRQLKREIQESKTTSASIKVLLRNMLPAHVVNMFWKVDAYLKHRVSHEPYYEHHRCVAVMFATVVPDASITMDLGLMNDIVCHFDEILSMYKSPLKVEKIKIVNGTYMAACGLSAESTGRSFLGSLLLTSRKGLIDIRSNRFLRRIANVDIYDFGTQRRDTARSEHSDDTDSGASWVSEQSEAEPDNKMQTVVYRMASFALDLLKTVQTLNARLKEQRGLTNPPLSLRVGISSGEVAAGIVGYTTSHYDIWGNAVNMASRMDTTGVPDRIQVCEETANILGTYDILCSYRGMTYIKSLGELPTYFIEIDESFNFAYKGNQPNSKPDVTPRLDDASKRKKKTS